MAAERLTELVKQAIGIVSDDADVNNQIRIKALAVMRYINNGGANIMAENANEYEIQCIALGVNDLLYNGGYSEGFKEMARQIQLVGGDKK